MVHDYQLYKNKAVNNLFVRNESKEDLTFKRLLFVVALNYEKLIHYVFARTREVMTRGKTEVKTKKVLEQVMQYYTEIATDFKKNVYFPISAILTLKKRSKYTS